MLKNIILKNFNIKIIDYQLLKTIDTFVYKITDTQNHTYIVKLYKKNNVAIVEKIAQNIVFLSFIKNNTNLSIQTFPKLFFPLVDWESEQRYVVLCSWINGEKPTVFDKHFATNLGEMMAKLHLAAELFKEKIKVLDIDNQLIANVQAKILKTIQLNKNQVQKLNIVFEKISHLLLETGKEKSSYGLIHSDLHFDNILIKDNILSPIDFDETAYGHFLTDIAVTFNEMELYKNHKMLKKYYEIGYKKHRKLPENFTEIYPKFQVVAAALYLNWFCDDGNEDVRKNSEMQKYGKKMLNKMLKF
jgi:Ser/Thr protein kinase RdoA (MazF antagonist)